jgi:hypothetical protein
VSGEELDAWGSRSSDGADPQTRHLSEVQRYIQQMNQKKSRMQRRAQSREEAEGQDARRWMRSRHEDQDAPPPPRSGVVRWIVRVAGVLVGAGAPGGGVWYSSQTSRQPRQESPA